MTSDIVDLSKLSEEELGEYYAYHFHLENLCLIARSQGFTHLPDGKSILATMLEHGMEKMFLNQEVSRRRSKNCSS